jgi:hypothetical protein
VVLSSYGEEGEDVLESPPAIKENITLQALEKPPTLTHPPIAKIGLKKEKNHHNTLYVSVHEFRISGLVL